MIDAYTIGITLALQDGVSDGILAIRHDLTALDAAVASSAAQILTLRKLAADIIAPALPIQAGQRPALFAPPVPPRQRPAPMAIADMPTLPDVKAPPPAVPIPQPSVVIATPQPGIVVSPALSPAAAAPVAPAAVREPSLPRASLSANEMTSVRQPILSPAPSPAMVPPAAPVVVVSSPAVTSPSPKPSPVEQPSLPDFAAIARSLTQPARSHAAETAQRPLHTTVPQATAEPLSSPSSPVPPTAMVSAPPTSPPLRQPESPILPTVLQPRLPAVSDAPSAPRQSAAPIAPMRSTPPSQVVPMLMPASAASSVETSDRQEPGRPVYAEIHLDGVALGRWVTRHLERQVNRPPAGATGFDPRMTPSWAGAPVGN